MILVLFAGFLYDIIGRRKTLFVSFMVSAAMAFIMPFTAPSLYPGLLIVRIVFSMAIMPI